MVDQQTKLTDEFEEIRQQLDEHLSTINENTSEVQALFDYLKEIDTKLDKLSQRVEQVEQSNRVVEKKSISLTQIERQTFIALYTEESPLSYPEIAVKANLPLSLVPECISSLIEKGVPFIRSFYGDKLFLKIDQKFKDLQAKENMINLSLRAFIE